MMLEKSRPPVFIAPMPKSHFSASLAKEMRG